jgi:hypothetical protein
MNKQWIYRNGQMPFSVTDIELPDGDIVIISIVKSGYTIKHNPLGRRIDASSLLREYDLIPYKPYADFKIDDKVNVTDFKDGDPIQAHWSGLDEDGKPTTFAGGKTSFTSSEDDQLYVWNFCEKANKEDK